MLSKLMRNFWRRVPLVFSILPAALLAWGFRDALSQARGNPVPAVSAPVARPAAAGEFLVVGVGDSLTRGAGEGPGYVADVVEHLKAVHPKSRLENLAIDGLESEGLKEILSHPYPRALASSAGLILLSIGGNDLSHAVPREMRTSLPEEIVRSRSRLESNLESILSTLRSANPSAPIVMLGLYNPFSSSDSGAAASGVIVDWNASIERIALRHGVRVVPVFDLFERRPDRLSPDRFHPNRGAYELVADRVLQAL
jgi:lysophospholipase L1-like esterase